jgi:signal transduction histidine kinase
MLAISVTDDGPGIPPETLQRMFEQKFTTKAPDSGTGLGLSIVRRLLIEASGAIHLQSKVGAGSSFTVLLPVKRLG